MRIIKRNMYRLPNLIDKLPALNGKQDTTEESTNSTDGKVSSDVSRECCVCGYAVKAPPINFVLSSLPPEPSTVTPQPVRTRGRRRREVASPQRNLSQMISISDSWMNEVDAFSKRYEKNQEDHCIQFLDDGRGCFWRCVCCDCVIHEQCLDFKDQWMLFEDSEFKCKFSSSLISRFYVSSLPVQRSYYKLFPLQFLLLFFRSQCESFFCALVSEWRILLCVWKKRWLHDNGIK